MASRPYTPLVPAYNRSAGNGVNNGLNQGRGGESPEKTPLSSASLQSLQKNQFQKIPLDSVLQDFKNTMNSIGTTVQIQAEMAAYFNVIRLQAFKEEPDVAFIKQTLRTAATVLDQFISKALNQPSHVVKEWVDALLLQNIDFRTQVSAPATPSTNAFSLVNPSVDIGAEMKVESEQATSVTPAVVVNANRDSLTGKKELKDSIEAAKIDQKAGRSKDADEKLQNALDVAILQNQPGWEGKVWQLRGSFYHQNGQWEKAIPALEYAVQAFAKAELPARQANSLHTMGTLYESHGQWEKAKICYELALELDKAAGDLKSQLRSLNDLGSLYLQQGHEEEAIPIFNQAVELMKNQSVSASIQSDVFNNLGVAYRQAHLYAKAIRAYQQSLKAAKSMNDHPRYINTLQQIASLFVESQQPEEAMKILKYLKAYGELKGKAK